LKKSFGEAMGEYLFQVCRGLDPGIYTGVAKSHSISTERTFSDDIADINILDTYILEMSHEILFRSLKEKQMARVVAIKIRYSDFSTVSAQCTPSEPIYSAEQVYEYALSLFNKKWKKLPIRLIGVGLYQTYSGESPYQEDLFDEDNKKRRTLEKVALELKTSGQHLTKATLLNKSIKNINNTDD
jgi:DNA polymerase-4